MSRSSALPVCALVVALLGCQKKEEAAPMMEEAAPAPASAPAYDGGASADRMASVGAPAPSIGAPAPQRQFVRSADLRFRTKSVEAATRSIQSIVAVNGGFVELDDLHSEVREQRSRPYGTDSLLEISRVDVTNTLQLRVPNDRLDTVLARIAPLVAFLDHRTVRAQDVGLELRRAERERRRLDRDSRRIQDLIVQSNGKLKDKAAADEQVLEREDRADAASVHLDDLQGQVELSAIAIALYQHPETRQDTLERPLYEIWREPFAKRIARSWADGWDGFVSLVLWLVSIWVWVALVAGAVFLFLRRRRSGKLPAD